jgi:hypothetical protein
LVLDVFPVEADEAFLAGRLGRHGGSRKTHPDPLSSRLSAWPVRSKAPKGQPGNRGTYQRPSQACRNLRMRELLKPEQGAVWLHQLR